MKAYIANLEGNQFIILASSASLAEKKFKKYLKRTEVASFVDTAIRDTEFSLAEVIK